MSNSNQEEAIVMVEKINAYTTAANTGAEGISSLLNGVSSFMKTQSDIDNERREQDREDKLADSKLKTENLEQDIARDKHFMEREIHNSNMGIGHMENSAKATYIKGDATKKALEDLLEKKRLEEELLKNGVSKEEIERTIRETEEQMIMSNPVYRDSLKLQKELLELQIEAEVRKAENIRELKLILLGIENNGDKIDNPGMFGDKGQVPTGRIAIRDIGFGRKVIEYIPCDLTTTKDYTPIKFECNLHNEECVDPKDLDTIKIDGVEISLKGIGAYNVSFSLVAPSLNIFNALSGKDTFVLPTPTIEHLYTTVLKHREREYLSLLEKDEFMDMLTVITEGIKKHAENKALRYYVTGESEGIVSKSIGYIGDGVSNALDYAASIRDKIWK